MKFLAEEMKKDFYERYKGREMEVLLEQKMKNGKYHGTTANYMDVFVENEKNLCGEIVKVRL